MLLSVVVYMIASSLMLIANKFAIETLQRPMTLLSLQLLFSCAVVYIIYRPRIDMKIIKAFWLVPCSFVVTLFCNVKILSYTNVETFIVIRSSTPIIMSVLDVQFLNKQLPGVRSWVSIFGVFIFANVYVYFENSELNTTSAFWLVSWYVSFCIDQIYIKHVVENVKMSLNERVFYNNVIPLVFLIPFALYTEDMTNITFDEVTLFAVGMSCFLGLAMSYAAFWARKEVSATAFTVVGNVCKILTVFINFVVWDKHATRNGIIALIICLAFSAMYRQANDDDYGRDKKKLGWFYRVFMGAFVVYLLYSCNKPPEPNLRDYKINGPINLSKLNQQVQKDFMMHDMSWKDMNKFRYGTKKLEDQIPTTLHAFIDDIKASHWTSEMIDKLIVEVIEGNDISPKVYPTCMQQIQTATRKIDDTHPVRILVAGSISPWVEATILAGRNLKMAELSTVDFNDLQIDDNRIIYRKMGSVPTNYFDVVISFSSIEHDGLGRYGDPIDPFGDFHAVKEYNSFLKNGGTMFLGLPVSKSWEKGYIVGNLHRIYSKERLKAICESSGFTDTGEIIEPLMEKDVLQDWQYQPILIWKKNGFT